jgi:hypothetical protein
MVTVISEGTRRARVSHKCFHCYRLIGPGETYGYQTCKYDGVYTLRWHLDCEAMAEEYRDPSFYADEGWGPLRDDLQASGQYQEDLDAFRGSYPHVVCRMELTDQLRAPSGQKGNDND